MTTIEQIHEHAAEVKRLVDTLPRADDQIMGHAISELRHQSNVLQSRVATVAGLEALPQRHTPEPQPSENTDHDRNGMSRFALEAAR